MDRGLRVQRDLAGGGRTPRTRAIPEVKDRRLAETNESPDAMQRSTRMSPDDRKQSLLRKAVEYFSEEGFDGGTRGLARQIGITQPLIYRYFPSKEDLINEVYGHVFVSQWKDEWAIMLRDRRRPLRERLLAFYHSYTAAVFQRTWMRIFFFAGLRGLDINKRYMQRVMDHILTPICEETRAHLGIEIDRPITAGEMDLVLMMHGAIFYQGMRRHIYQISRSGDPDKHARLAIDMFLCSARKEVLAALEESRSQPIDSGPSAPLQ